MMDTHVLDLIEEKIRNLISKYKILQDKYIQVLKENENLNNKYKDLFYNSESSQETINELKTAVGHYTEQNQDLQNTLAQKEELIQKFSEQANEIDSRVGTMLQELDAIIGESETLSAGDSE